MCSRSSWSRSSIGHSAAGTGGRPLAHKPPTPNSRARDQGEDPRQRGAVRIADPNQRTSALAGEVDKADTFKDPVMLRRLHDLQALSDKDRDHILYALDGLLRDAKARIAYA